ncbi:hypothetical protein AB5N19_07547 [Seiridium cardinale]
MEHNAGQRISDLDEKADSCLEELSELHGQFVTFQKHLPSVVFAATSPPGFPLFRRLPLEIRNMIWKCAIPARLLEINEISEDMAPGIADSLNLQLLLPATASQSVASLRVFAKNEFAGKKGEDGGRNRKEVTLPTSKNNISEESHCPEKQDTVLTGSHHFTEDRMASTASSCEYVRNRIDELEDGNNALRKNLNVYHSLLLFDLWQFNFWQDQGDNYLYLDEDFGILLVTQESWDGPAMLSNEFLSQQRDLMNIVLDDDRKRYLSLYSRILLDDLSHASTRGGSRDDWRVEERVGLIVPVDFMW